VLQRFTNENTFETMQPSRNPVPQETWVRGNIRNKGEESSNTNPQAGNPPDQIQTPNTKGKSSKTNPNPKRLTAVFGGGGIATASFGVSEVASVAQTLPVWKPCSV
jgi:hypothetical protein